MRLPSNLVSRIVALSISVFMTSAGALELPPGVTQGPGIEGTTQYTLANGLTVLLTPDDSKPTTIVNMTYLVGSRHENRGQTGMAHLLEHMLFRGSPTLRDPWAEFSRRGLRANGSTNEDRTNYYASFASNPETLAWYLNWQADAMVNSLIAKEDLDSEMTVVRNEMERDENDPGSVLMQHMQAAAYMWHAYGRDTIGARSDVENVDVGQLRNFYHQYYQPDYAVLLVSGKFDPQTTLQTISQAFGKIPRPTRSLPPEYTVEPVQDGERAVTVRRHGGSPMVASLFHVPQAGSPDYVPLSLGVDILSDTPSGRLYHDLVGKKLAADVFGFSRPMYAPGYAVFGAQLDDGMDPGKALKALESSLESLPKHPFTQTDLDRVKDKWRSNWSQVYADPAHLTGALSSATAAGDWRLLFLQRDQMEKATLQDVQRITESYLVRSNRSSGMYIPTDSPVRAPLPQAVDLQALLKDYRGQAAPDVTLAFEPTPANIDAATRREPLALPNGQVQLALLPKPTRGNRVEAALLIQFSDAEGLRGKRVAAAATASLLDRGTADLNRQQIQDKLTALQANLNFSGGAGSVVARMSVTGESLPEVVKLALHIIRHASFPESELAEFQSQASASIKSAMTDPESLAARTLARHDNPWAPDDVRYTPSFEQALADIASLKRDDLVRFHQDYYGAGTVRFSAVGSFEPEAVKTALIQGLEGWKKAPAYTRVADPYQPVPPKRFDINTPDKANAVYLSMLPLKIQDNDPRYAALYVANYLLGGSQTSRLWNRVRVKEGLSYTVNSGLDASSYEPSGNWSLYAIFAPENRARLEQAIQDELGKALRDGFSDAEIKDGVESLLRLRQLNRTRDGILATVWLNYMQEKRTFAWSAEIDAALKKLTAADVNSAMREVLKPDLFSTAVAADQKKAEPRTQ